MAWYRAGTTAVTKNSKTVTGTGTAWSNPANGVGAGQMLLLPAAGSVAMYEIASVQSNTQLTLADAFSGTTATGQAYAIVTTYIDSVPDFARRLATQLTYYQSQLDGWQKIMTGSGDISLAAPDGTTVTIKSMAAVTTAISNMMDRSKNGSDIPDKAAFRTNLGLIDAVRTDLGLGKAARHLVDFSVAALETPPNGFWRYTNTTLNKPSPGGVAMCLQHDGSPSYFWLAISNSGEIFISRTVTSISSITWVKILSDGDYGLGSTTLPETPNYANLLKTGFYRVTDVPVDKPFPNWGSIINVGYSSTAGGQVYIKNDSAKVDIRVRSMNGGVFSPIASLWHSGNTAVDTNGFIKKASPIVKLFGDGASEVNEESQGVTAERLSAGVYKISGSLGFNLEGWNIETPMNNNGLPLLWLDYDVEENGTINLRTYHRTHPTAPPFARNVIEGYEDGQPIDIPAGRWIDLRLEMPQSADISEADDNSISDTSDSEISAA